MTDTLNRLLPDLPRPSTAREVVMSQQVEEIQNRLEGYRASLDLPENAFQKTQVGIQYME